MNLYAWKNIMPGSTTSLHAVGQIRVPTPCDEPITSHLPEDPNRPLVYRIKVSFVKLAENCIQIPVIKNFKYEERNYHGGHTQLEATYPDGTTEIADIQIVS